MEVYLDKLTFTLSLWLYRLPRTSQLLCHLGPDWHVPSPGDLPLAVPANNMRQGSQTQHPTTLEALTLRVPVYGPKIDVMVIAPWEVPNWGAQKSIKGVCAPKKSLTWVQSLVELGDRLNNAYVFVAGVVHKQRWEEDGDSATVGGASLISLFKENNPSSSSFKWAVGEGLLQFDVDVEVLAKAGEYLNAYGFWRRVNPLSLFTFFWTTRLLYTWY